MQFVERFEPICRLISGDVVSLGLYKSYEEANDAAILQASVNLPEECVTCYTITKVYVNAPVWTSQDVQKGGIK